MNLLCDIVWMGAAAGSEACIATVLRTSATYANLGTIEDGCGISLLLLATFAIDSYEDDEYLEFKSKIENDENYHDKEINIIAKMHKAIAII